VRRARGGEHGLVEQGVGEDVRYRQRLGAGKRNVAGKVLCEGAVDIFIFDADIDGVEAAALLLFGLPNALVS
jgi:hypothetical protein